MPEIAPREQRVEHHGGTSQQRRQPVRELVAPREHPQLHLVEPAQRRADVERDGVEEVDDLDPVAIGLEPTPELFRGSIVSRAH